MTYTLQLFGKEGESVLSVDYDEFKKFLSRPLTKQSPFHVGLALTHRGTYLIQIGHQCDVIGLTTERTILRIESYPEETRLCWGLNRGTRRQRIHAVSIFNQDIIDRRGGRKISSKSPAL